METRKIFIVTHSNLAEGFKNAAKLIVGEAADMMTTFCLYEGGSADDFRDEVVSYMERKPKQEIVVLTDLYGASLFNAMAPLSNQKNVFVFSGINLALVIEVLLEPAGLNEDVINQALMFSKEGLMWLEKLESGIEEDF